jgi:hypothetical protein
LSDWLVALFVCLQTILLVWNESKFYNYPARLAVLIREICNALIRQALQFVQSTALFEGDPQLAVDNLKSALKVIVVFKSVYFNYKALAQTQNKSNPWRFQNSALFARLDAFLERYAQLQHGTKRALGREHGSYLLEQRVHVTGQVSRCTGPFGDDGAVQQAREDRDRRHEGQGSVGVGQVDRLDQHWCTVPLWSACTSASWPSLGFGVKFLRHEVICPFVHDGMMCTFRSIYEDFSRAADKFRQGSYEIMDVEVKAFDDDYHTFRSQISELERRSAP